TSVAVTPAAPTATIGATVQFTATVNGTGAYNTGVTWAAAGPPGWAGGVGTIGNSGLYVTPYPAPPSVTVTATAAGDAAVSGHATVTLVAPAAAAGPALTVDAGNPTRPISPLIYGMNGWGVASTAAALVDLPVDRWGGDAATRYNYLTDVSNAAADWYFETDPNSNTAYPDTSQFNSEVEQDEQTHTLTLGTMPLIGWTTTRQQACSYAVAKYGAQQQTDPYNANCGNGVLANGDAVVNDPTDTSFQIDDSWTTKWMQYLVGKFGTAAQGGIAIYDLDNEPEWWDATHRDLRNAGPTTPPAPYTGPFTYDELVSKGLTYAAAMKAQDPTAEVSGPVDSWWWTFFYSKKDVEAGWTVGGGPCYQPWSNPVDREAHGGVPLLEYYLQQFAQYEAQNHLRLLDYLDLHGYFGASYNGTGVGLTTAGDTGEQQVRLDSTRAMWDPAYNSDPNFVQPNYLTDANYTTSCNVPLQAPQLIPMMEAWVEKDYPGTKTAISEYNWGGQEHINGALAQADLLGIFGKYGLDLATLWGPPDPATQFPGLAAFLIYRNYDGAHSKFGDTALASSSGNQGQLAVYGAVRSSDQAVTVVVINKTFGALTSTLALPHLTATASAQVFQYSAANLAAIVPLGNATVTPPSTGSTTSSIVGYSFPASSITLFVIPQ
ncbi:MAG: glycoside hydrolase family 44 protein, partial [Acidobacteriaceae bacterium]